MSDRKTVHDPRPGETYRTDVDGYPPKGVKRVHWWSSSAKSWSPLGASHLDPGDIWRLQPPPPEEPEPEERVEVVPPISLRKGARLMGFEDPLRVRDLLELYIHHGYPDRSVVDQWADQHEPVDPVRTFHWEQPDPEEDDGWRAFKEQEPEAGQWIEVWKRDLFAQEVSPIRTIYERCNRSREHFVTREPGKVVRSFYPEARWRPCSPPEEPDPKVTLPDDWEERSEQARQDAREEMQQQMRDATPDREEPGEPRYVVKERDFPHETVVVDSSTADGNFVAIFQHVRWGAGSTHGRSIATEKAKRLADLLNAGERAAQAAGVDIEGVPGILRGLRAQAEEARAELRKARENANRWHRAMVNADADNDARVDELGGRITELEAEVERLQGRFAVASDLLHRVVVHGSGEQWSNREMFDWCCDYRNLKNGMEWLHEKGHESCSHRQRPDSNEEPVPSVVDLEREIASLRERSIPEGVPWPMVMTWDGLRRKRVFLSRDRWIYENHKGCYVGGTLDACLARLKEELADE